MTARLLLFSFTAALGLAGISARAEAPAVLSVSGATTATISGTGATIFGGLAGSPKCTATDNAPCNSCATTTTCSGGETLCACNEVSVYDNLQLTITVRSQADNANFTLLAETEDNTTVTKQGSNATSITFLWKDLCAKMDTPAACSALTTSAKVTLKLAFDSKTVNGEIDTDEEATSVTVRAIVPGSNYDIFGSPNSEGISDFKGFPGDEKIFVIGTDGEDLASGDSSAFPILNYGSKAIKVRMYISDSSMLKANYKDAVEIKDLDLETDGGALARNIVDGLDNFQLYFFRMALIDEGGNVVQHVPSTATAAAAGTSCTTSPSKDCPWAATPDAVLGLLTKDLNCFIASAAYGSSLEPKLAAFRKFRGNVLLQRDWGRWFVRTYYKYGPYAARFIQDKPAVRAVARGALWPMYGFAELTFKIGFTKALLSVLAGLLAVAGLTAAAVRRFSRG